MDVKDVFVDLPTLETDRLLLRKLEADDVDDVFAYASDPEVAKYTSWPAHATIEDSAEFLAYVLELYRKGQVAPWGVVHEGKVVGIGWGPAGPAFARAVGDLWGSRNGGRAKRQCKANQRRRAVPSG